MSTGQCKYYRSWAPLIVALLATFSAQHFRMSCQWNTLFVYIEWLIAAALVLVMVSWPAWKGRAKIREVHGRWSRVEVLCCVCLVLLPVVVQWVVRAWDAGDAYEIVVLSMVQNAAVAAAIAARDLKSASISLVLSSFLLLFVSFIYPNSSSYVLVALGTVAVLWWLVGNYWQRTQSHQAVRTTLRMPMRAMIVTGTFGLAGVVALAAQLLVPENAWLQVAGWIPFSGGDRWGSVHARDGVGQGDILTGAKDRADTIGPVETNIYLSSQQPSLYDMISRAYGPPSKRHEQRIDIEGYDQTHQHEQMTFAAAAREFSTQRRPRQHRDGESSQPPVAMLFYEGVLPAHLRLQTFDTFDGTTWQQTEQVEPPHLYMQDRQGQPWIGVLPTASNSVPEGVSRSIVTLVNLQTIRLPMPALPSAWHIARVDRLSFFGWTADDVPQMLGRDQVPPLVPVLVETPRTSYYALRFGAAAPRQRESVSQGNSGHDVGAMDQVHRNPNLGNAFERELTSLRKTGLQGMLLIERVETRLRTQFVWDQDGSAPDGDENPVEWFLARGQGPDYLFATAAANLLRELGFETRLVQGFYVDRRHYDAKAKKHVAWADDIHTWVEVQCATGSWIPIEVCPGYELPLRHLSWGERAWLAGRITWEGLLARWYLALTGLLLAGALYRWRVAAVGYVLRCVWPMVQWLPVRTQVLWCSRVLAWRWRLQGERRSEHETWRAWLSRMSGREAELQQSEAVSRWLELWERLSYGHHGHVSADLTRGARDVCRQVIWTAFDG